MRPQLKQYYAPAYNSVVYLDRVYIIISVIVKIVFTQLGSVVCLDVVNLIVMTCKNVYMRVILIKYTKILNT